MPPENQQDKKQEKSVEQNVHPVSPFKEPLKEHYTTNPDLKTLRTYQGDVEETIKGKKESVVSIVVAEKESKKEPPNLLPEKKGMGVFVTRGILPLLGIILFVSGVGALVIIYYKMSSNNAPIEVALNSSLIQYTDKKSVDLDATKLPVGISAREIITKNLSSELSKYNKPAGSVLYLQFLYNKVELSSEDFFRNVAVSAPPALTRAFGQKYMAGVYSFDTNGIFLISSVDDYGNAYTGMLKWENSIAEDLPPLFKTSELSSVSFSVASGTPIFKDDAFNNQDVRILRNSSGETVLVYGFADKNTLIITSDEKIYQAIVNKYRNNKLVR